MCCKLDPSSYSYSTTFYCSPAVLASSTNIHRCSFQLTLTTDYVQSRLYLSYLNGKHNHGIEDCALKCRADSFIFGITEVKPRSASSSSSSSVVKSKRHNPSRTLRTKKMQRGPSVFTLSLSILEMFHCSEPVGIPEDASLQFQFTLDMEDEKFILCLKNKYFSRVK
ncbi:unnamed protein product [Ambrosiozyma monospora]|uniref:Unnamed protein product n=1 Tax=Ambrosiozyma monospora TaxID=43982 RepID=A0ACB5TLA4_AMBMO|nr:unnamed protein product [Ambrosiozyma monospora]